MPTDRRCHAHDFLEKSTDPKQKNSCIPQVLASSHHVFGAPKGGLLDKTSHFHHAWSDLRAHAEVSITRVGAGRPNSEGHKPPAGGSRFRPIDSLMEGSNIFNHMIARHYEQERV